MIFQNEQNCGEVLFSLNIPETDIMESKRLWTDSPELREALCSPTVYRTEKHCVIDSVFPKRVAPFVKVICDFGQAKRLGSIFEAYENILRKSRNIVRGTLTCAASPTADMIESVKNMLCRKYSADNAELEIVVDESLISGFRLNVGDYEYDKSVQGTLKALQSRLVRR